jgi:hypothetical protein
MRSERRTVAWVLATALTLVTGPTRRTMSIDSSGSSTGDCSLGTGSARSMLVPSADSSVINACWLEAGMPVTTIIVAMPMEIPSADRAARSLRVRMPSRPRPRRSRGARRTGRDTPFP